MPHSKSKHLKSELRAEITVTFARSSGPGGQNVNKVNSKATLSWPVEPSKLFSDDLKIIIKKKFEKKINSNGSFIIQSDKYRTQARNAEDCIEKLCAFLFPLTLPTKSRKATKPTKRSKEKRLQQKKERSERKQGRVKVKF